jgi:hypothetical protein
MPMRQGDVALLDDPVAQELLRAPLPARLERLMGEELGTQVMQQLGSLVPHMGGMVRIRVRPEWVGIIDFQTRLPSAVERAMEAAQTGAGSAPVP